MSLSKYLLLFGLLAVPIAEAGAQSLAMRAQSITTGDDAFDAGTDLDVTGLTSLTVVNTGSVTVHLAWTQAAATAAEPAVILTAGQRVELFFEAGYGPASVWTKGVGAAGTVTVTAANKRGKAVLVPVDPEALADQSRVRVRTFTVLHGDLTEADTSEDQVDPAGALPAGAVLMGYRKRVDTAFSGGGNSAVTVDCGFNGATDVVDDGQTVFTGVAAATYGAGANALPTIRRAVGGLVPQCTFVTVDGTAAGLTAGSASFDYFYTVPAGG